MTGKSESALQPGVTESAEALNTRGVEFIGRGLLEEATACFQRAVQLDPNLAVAQSNLGAALKRKGKLDEAVFHLLQALRLRPDLAEVHSNLGNALREQGNLVEAMASFREALRLRPDYPEALHNMGNALVDQGALEEARACFERTLELKPNYLDAYLTLSNVLMRQGRFGEAEIRLAQALHLKPDYVQALVNLGVVHHAQGKTDQAVLCYRRALEYRPNLPEAHINLANVLRDQGLLHEALGSYQKALQERPSTALRLQLATLLPPIYTSQSDVHAWRKRLTENLGQLRREQITVDLNKNPGLPLFYLAYQGMNDRDIQREAALLYSVQPVPLPVPVPHSSGTGTEDGIMAEQVQGNGRIKVGFVSRHFRNHTIGELMRGTLANLSRDDFAVIVFSLGAWRDKTAQFIREHAERFVELPEDLPTARRQIAAHELDVLVYPDIGMEELTYSLAFSRLARVQCAFWGHPVTTGIATIDYFLSSELLETAAADQHYTETLVRLPGAPVYYCRPTLESPQKGRTAFGLPEDSHLYACPQSLFKLHPDFDPILAEILRRDPKGMLVLIQGKYPSWAETLQRRFASTLGQGAGRVLFLERLGRTDFLNLNVLVDVLLDPLHFGGGNSSYEALAFGVPLVTLPSHYLRGRITLALYKQMNVMDCVAADPEEYVKLAVRLGTDPDYRTLVRAKILAANGVLYENLSGVRALEVFFRSAVAHARPVSGSSEAWNEQGIKLIEQGRLHEALASFREAVHLRPDNAEALNNLGAALKLQEQFDEAIARYRKALQLKPDFPEAYSNLGNVLRLLGRPGEAVESFQHALRLKPNYAEAQNNLSNALKDQGMVNEALAGYERALELKPDYVEAHLDRAVTWLLLGDFEKGWTEFEWRWQYKDFPPRPFRQPRWDGAPLGGRRILLHAEQGLGDTIQFIRYAASVKERGGRVIVECQPPLLRLLAGCAGIDELIGQGAMLPTFDVHSPLFSLPYVFRTSMTTIPVKIPYLFADPGLTEQWRRELACVRDFKVGICWQGNPRHTWDRLRSISLGQFAPLARLDGVQLFSLQKGPGSEQIKEAVFPITDLASRFDEARGPFMDAAAVMKNLDLVISADTSVAHLAGALGVPVWIALPFLPDWRWLLEREDSPWYPTVRLFRQTNRGSWQEVFERIVAEVEKLSRKSG
jgi:predicted O-linked N-acetylglucosamine transferase (SPINDLY family)